MEREESVRDWSRCLLAFFSIPVFLDRMSWPEQTTRSIFSFRVLWDHLFDSRIESFGVLSSLEALSALFQRLGCSFLFHDLPWSAMHAGGRRVYSSWVALHAYCMGFVCDTT